MKGGDVPPWTMAVVDRCFMPRYAAKSQQLFKGRCVMKKIVFFRAFARAKPPIHHDDSLRANQFEETPYTCSPWLASIGYRHEVKQ